MSHKRKNEFSLVSYGGLEHRPDIRQVLRKSDRKIQTTERDNKRVDFIYSQEDQIADLIPSREDSFERLEEEENMQFVSPCIGVEDEIILRELHENLYRALEKLNSNEKALLLARFHENKSQQDAAEELGISQQAVSRWEKRILRKLRKWLET